MTPDEIAVRPMVAEDKPAATRSMRRAFSPIEQLFFSWSQDVLLAERHGEIVGGIVLKVFALPKGGKAGLISWLWTDPAVRGLGGGQRLVETALALFEARGCDEVMACVEGYNPSSSKQFATRGFSILSMGEQWRRYGPRFLEVWYRAFHLVDIGHFLWVRPGAQQPDSPTLQWIGTGLANMLVLLLVAWRVASGGPVLPLWGRLAAIWLLFFALRTAAMALAAHLQGKAMRYRAWESGFPLALLLAALFRGFFPLPGSLYPAADQESWRYREWLPALGRMALAGIAPTVALSWLIWAARRFGWGGAPWAPWTHAAPLIAAPLCVIEVLFAFFPLACFNGRRLWDWSRSLWLAVAVAAVAAVAWLFV
jgi:ribosomal protein S18 acetylase RimI-like enzyme